MVVLKIIIPNITDLLFSFQTLWSSTNLKESVVYHPEVKDSVSVICFQAVNT